MALMEGYPEEIRKKRKFLATMMLVGDTSIAAVFLLSANMIGDGAFIVAPLLVITGVLGAIIMLKLPFDTDEKPLRILNETKKEK